MGACVEVGNILHSWELLFNLKINEIMERVPYECDNGLVDLLVGAFMLLALYAAMWLVS